MTGGIASTDPPWLTVTAPVWSQLANIGPLYRRQGRKPTAYATLSECNRLSYTSPVLCSYIIDKWKTLDEGEGDPVDGLDRQKPKENLPSMSELLLPQTILAKASLRGLEYAWSFGDLREVVEAARTSGLATLGGQVQFRVPEGTCELYWFSIDSAPRQSGEPWSNYVDRCAREVLEGIDNLPPVSELVSEGIRNFNVLGALHSSGTNLVEHLCMVLYFTGTESSWGYRVQKRADCIG